MEYTVQVFSNRIAALLGVTADKAYKAGVLELQDMKETPLTKQAAARIVHRALLYLGEHDERNVEKAFSLKDIYDCHTCVMHVAQVYVKGIMEPSEELVFGMQKALTGEEAEVILSRIKNKSDRKN